MPARRETCREGCFRVANRYPQKHGADWPDTADRVERKESCGRTAMTTTFSSSAAADEAALGTGMKNGNVRSMSASETSLDALG